MKRNLIKFLLIIIAIIYIIIGALLFINIQFLESPEIIMEIEVSDINPDVAVIKTKIDIDNSNSFDIFVKNLRIITTTSGGFQVANSEIAGGIIPANEKRTFTKDINIAFGGHNPELLTSKVTGDVGMSILFIEKTIPLNMGVITSLEKVINDFASPSISAEIDFKEFTTEMINLSAMIDAYNPNSFEIYIEDIVGEIKTETGKIIGEIDVIDGILPPKESIEINTTGWMLLEAFNADKIIFNVNGIAGVKIAGFDKNLSFNAETRLIVPDLEELILSKENPVILSIKTKNKITLKGVVTEVYLEVENTYKVDLELRDIICRLNTVVGDEIKLLGENNIEEGLITEAGTTNSAVCEITIPFSKILTDVPTSDWLLVTVIGRMTIKDINPSVYVEIRGYTDIHIFR